MNKPLLNSLLPKKSPVYDQYCSDSRLWTQELGFWCPLCLFHGDKFGHFDYDDYYYIYDHYFNYDHCNCRHRHHHHYRFIFMASWLAPFFLWSSSMPSSSTPLTSKLTLTPWKVIMGQIGFYCGVQFEMISCIIC